MLFQNKPIYLAHSFGSAGSKRRGAGSGWGLVAGLTASHHGR